MSYIGDIPNNTDFIIEEATNTPNVRWVQFSDDPGENVASVDSRITALRLNWPASGYQGTINRNDSFSPFGQASVGGGHGSVPMVTFIALSAAGLVFTVNNLEANVSHNLVVHDQFLRKPGAGSFFMSTSFRAALFETNYNWSTISNQSARDLIDNATIKLSPWASPVRFSINSSTAISTFQEQKSFLAPMKGTISNGVHSLWSAAYYPIIESSSDSGSLNNVKFIINTEVQAQFLIYDWKASAP